MKLYDRQKDQRAVEKSDSEEFRQWSEYDEWRFNKDYPYEDDITLDDVRKGWLFSLLIKLGLRSPKEWIRELNW